MFSLLTVTYLLFQVPRGPTLSFRVSSYMVAKDVISTLKRFKNTHNAHESAPLLIMNGFDETIPHHQLITTTFQNMLPAVNVKTVKLNTLKRCLLLNYDSTEDVIELRHYSISATPVGVNKAIKKLMKKVPDLSGYSDISEFLTNGYFSESDGEDGPDNQVVLPQNLAGRGNLKSNRSAIRLTELGPRLSLKLVKIQDGVGEGEVLYHSYVKKTAEEKKDLRKRIEKQKLLKEKRRKEQQKNVERKKKEKEVATKKRKRGETNEDCSDDDDVQYYKDEIGEAPDADLMLKTKRTDRSKNFKKSKPEPEAEPTETKTEPKSEPQSKRTKRSENYMKNKMANDGTKRVQFNDAKTKITHSKTANVKGIAFRRKKQP